MSTCGPTPDTILPQTLYYPDTILPRHYTTQTLYYCRCNYTYDTVEGARRCNRGLGRSYDYYCDYYCDY